MGPFALSVPPNRLGVHSHKQLHGTRQRDELSRAPSPHADSDVETHISSTSRLPSETINPLSHSPDTLRQLALAGLRPEDELPSQIHRRFPHEPLPTRSSTKHRKEPVSLFDSDGGATSGTETDATVTSQRTKKPEKIVDAARHTERMRHLSTMAAIMHRCLRDGDIPRAKRAFGLLLRTRDVDIRLDDLWAIGSEILMRDGEEARDEEGTSPPSEAKKPSSSSRRKSRGNLDVELLDDDDDDSDSSIAETEDEVLEEIDEEESSAEQRAPRPPQRWGSAANMAQVKLYFETLAQQYPHDPHRPRMPTAVTFWPALFGIELYNLDAELQSATHQIYTETSFPSPSSSRSASPDRDGFKSDGMDIDYDEEERGVDREGGGDGEASATRYAALDDLRAATQRGALEITSRMDTILENAPYSKLPELLRLRAHAALFIGDLHLSSRFVERCRRREQHEGGGAGGISLRQAERRLKAHVKTPEEHVALARRGEEQERARGFFRRVVEAKGRLEDWVLRSLDEDDEEEE
ncbi:hypothetical protein F5B22DRAFT_496767 [Xylaria bambusicola]|uniref:uncharacterized protein n=1 Tax=Xylaria bambusicola TaxID=326684 RepID=UPI002008B919|nr:uncharacterized protein F5B22DRAFT_496767 [Xylaria bambusicola]KAI0505773.1 hypothetical protein F5B22DRAFT_496767 [Xylaria bambusicola]